MKRIIMSVVVGSSLLCGIAGCGKKSEATLPAQGMATQGATPEAASTYADANLAELTRELRRWIVATKKRPTSFEDFATDAKVTVPPAPTGKKYALSKEMRVVLVDR
jgi:predicted small lipoprotein YifL